MAKRPTIVDVARMAGVSTAVVSYTLNGRPGVSAETRERVLRIAAECGWRPSSAARSLRAGPSSIGLVLQVNGGSFAGEDDLLPFVAGLQAVLSRRRIRALLHLADDPEAAIQVCTEWWAEREVFAVVIPKVQQYDRRIERLRALGIPAIGLDGPRTSGDSRPATPMVWSDEAAAFAHLAEYLLSLGHRRIALVSGHPELAVSRVRQEAFGAAVERGGGVASIAMATAPEVPPEPGTAATRRLLQSVADRPTAIVYDDDTMAISALDVARRMEIEVPGQLSIVAGADSVRCRLVTPALTALARDVQEYGRAAGEQLLQILDRVPGVGHRQVTTAVLTVRGSTAPAAR